VLGGGRLPSEIAAILLSSTEYRSDLVGRWYLEFLRRPAGPGERAQFVAALAQLADEVVIAQILGSPEYFHDFTHKGHVVLHWNRRVNGHRLARGTYELVLQVRGGHKLLDVSDAIRFTVR
jgi:hypothetical protein